MKFCISTTVATLYLGFIALLATHPVPVLCTAEAKHEEEDSKKGGKTSYLSTSSTTTPANRLLRGGERTTSMKTVTTDRHRAAAVSRNDYVLKEIIDIEAGGNKTRVTEFEERMDSFVLSSPDEDEEDMPLEVMETNAFYEKLPAWEQATEANVELDNMMLAIKNGTVSVLPKEKDPADIMTTSMEEIMEKIHDEMRRRGLRRRETIYNTSPSSTDDSRKLLAFSKSEVATLGDASNAVANGSLEAGLDILASTVVSGICFAVSWAAAAATAGVSVAAAPIVCASAGFWSGIIFSTFDWLNGIFGTPSNDDAWWSVEAAKSNYADGNSLGISYHRSGEVDKNSLGYIRRGQIKESREDLDAKKLIAIEVRVENTDDVCVKNMLFRIGKEPSGTGRVEEVTIPALIFSYITKSRLHNTKEMCIYFGDAEGAIGNFKFNWSAALTCQKNFGAYLTVDYAKCLTWAMYSYDVRRNGQFRRTTYSRSPRLPSYYSSPMREIKTRGRSSSWPWFSLCMNVKDGRTSNRNPVQLHACFGSNSERFDFDADGRLRSALDPTKCIEAGKAGNLYGKLFIYDCHNGEWQQWTRYTDGRIRNKGHGKYIGTAYCKRELGTRLELRWYEDGACGEAQKFSW